MYAHWKQVSWQFSPLFYFLEFTGVVHQVCDVTYPFMYPLSSSALPKQHKLSCQFFVPLLHH